MIGGDISTLSPGVHAYFREAQVGLERSRYALSRSVSHPAKLSANAALSRTFCETESPMARRLPFSIRHPLTTRPKVPCAIHQRFQEARTREDSEEMIRSGVVTLSPIQLASATKRRAPKIGPRLWSTSGSFLVASFQIQCANSAYATEVDNETEAID